MHIILPKATIKNFEDENTFNDSINEDESKK